MNMARAQMHSNSAGKVMYMGCIGDDERGRALSQAVAASGIEAKFEVTQADQTAVCAVLIVGKERSLCAHIAAAKHFSMDHLRANMVSLIS